MWPWLVVSVMDWWPFECLMTCSAVLNWISGEDGFKDCCNSVCISWCTASISDYHGFDYLRKNMNGIIHLLVLKLYFNWVVLLFNWAWNNTKMCEAKFSRRGFGSPSWGHIGFRPTLTASVIIKEPIVNVMNSLLQLSFTSLCEEKKTGAGYPGFVGLYFVISNTDFGSRKGIFG